MSKLLKGERYSVSPCMDQYPPIVIPDPFKRMPDELKDAGIETSNENQVTKDGKEEDPKEGGEEVAESGTQVVHGGAGEGEDKEGGDPSS